MEYIRQCPICNKQMTYKSKSYYNESIKNNRSCKSCSAKYKRLRKYDVNKQYSKTCINCGQIYIFSSYKKYLGSKPDNEYRCKSCASKKTHTNKVITNETRNKMIIAANNRDINWSEEEIKRRSDAIKGEKNPMYNSKRFGELNPFYNHNHSEDVCKNISKKIKDKWENDKEYRNKSVKSAKERVKKYGLPNPNYNKNSIKIIEDYGKNHGYNFQHAENGGEYFVEGLGYYLDGYDKEKNVVIEYYENYHKKQVDYDEKRKSEIIKKLGCKFIEIKEWETKKKIT